MGSQKTIYILGAGAIGCPWAVHLAEAGRAVVAVRTSRHAIPPGTSTVTVRHGANRISAPVATISLAKLTHLDGTIVIATKAYAHPALVRTLTDKGATGPVVILHNGVGVEPPFLAAQCSPLYRGVRDVTSQATAADDLTWRAVPASPIGTINGNASGFEKGVAALTTDGVPCRVEANRPSEVWKTASSKAVFPSIGPLLEVDPGVCARDAGTAQLAREVVRACVTLTDRLALG
jgi:2-dehydropantoate 2-reductase